VHWSPRNFSPKFLPTAARSSRGWAQGSGEKGGAKPCQGDAPEHGEEDRVGGRSRGDVAHQKLAALSGSIGGTATSGVRSLAAISTRVRRETSAGGGGGGLYRHVGERKSERNRRIDRARFSRPRLILSETWGRKDDVGSDAIVGPMCQREKRRERRTGSGEREKWAVGCLRSRAGFNPRGLLLFSYFLSLFFSIFF
jgi:hypothetical protein